MKMRKPSSASQSQLRMHCKPMRNVWLVVT
jgi:hypothetical protein